MEESLTTKDDTFTCDMLPASSDALLLNNVTCGAAQPQCTSCTHTFSARPLIDYVGKKAYAARHVLWVMFRVELIETFNEPFC